MRQLLQIPISKHLKRLLQKEPHPPAVPLEYELERDDYNSYQSVIEQYLAYMMENDTEGDRWIIGVSSQPSNDLFNTHEVNQGSDPWFHVGAFASSTVAHFVALQINAHPLINSHLIEQNNDGQFVYVFNFSRTRERSSSTTIQLAMA